MGDWMVVLAFWIMVLAPCFVALHAAQVEDGEDLGYAASLHKLKTRLFEALRI